MHRIKGRGGCHEREATARVSPKPVPKPVFARKDAGYGRILRGATARWAPVRRPAACCAEAYQRTADRLRRENSGSRGNACRRRAPERHFHPQRESRRLRLSPNLLSDYSEQPHRNPGWVLPSRRIAGSQAGLRSEEHTSELQSPDHIVCRLLLEKKTRSCYNAE